MTCLLSKRQNSPTLKVKKETSMLFQNIIIQRNAFPQQEFDSPIEGIFLPSFHNIMKRISILKHAQSKKAPMIIFVFFCVRECIIINLNNNGSNLWSPCSTSSIHLEQNRFFTAFCVLDCGG